MMDKLIFFTLGLLAGMLSITLWLLVSASKLREERKVNCTISTDEEVFLDQSVSEDELKF